MSGKLNIVITVPPASPPPPEPPPADTTLGKYRILNDYEVAAYNFASRTADPEWAGNDMTPETIKFHGGQTPLTISDAAAKLVFKLDELHGTYGYVTRTSAGWSNRGQEFPKVEELTFCDNVVDVIRIEGNRRYIRTWRGEEADPCVIHRWVNIDSHNSLFGCQNPGGDGLGFIVLDYPDGVWLEAERLIKVEDTGD
jgi:hypothetical protein